MEPLKMHTWRGQRQRGSPRRHPEELLPGSKASWGNTAPVQGWNKGPADTVCSVALSGFLLSKPYSWMNGTVSPMVCMVDHGVGENAVVLNTDRPGIDCCCG